MRAGNKFFRILLTSTIALSITVSIGCGGRLPQLIKPPASVGSGDSGGGTTQPSPVVESPAPAPVTTPVPEPTKPPVVTPTPPVTEPTKPPVVTPTPTPNPGGGETSPNPTPNPGGGETPPPNPPTNVLDQFFTSLKEAGITKPREEITKEIETIVRLKPVKWSGGSFNDETKNIEEQFKKRKDLFKDPKPASAEEYKDRSMKFGEKEKGNFVFFLDVANSKGKDIIVLKFDKDTKEVIGMHETEQTIQIEQTTVSAERYKGLTYRSFNDGTVAATPPAPTGIIFFYSEDNTGKFLVAPKFIEIPEGVYNSIKAANHINSKYGYGAYRNIGRYGTYNYSSSITRPSKWF